MTLEESFFQSVRARFAQHTDPLWIAAAVALLALLFALLAWRSSRGARRAELAVARTVAARQNLSTADFEYLGRLARASRVALPDLLTRIAVFERVTARALAEETPTPNPGVVSVFARVRDLRAKLGFDVLPPHHWLFTTRELARGEKLTVAGRPALVLEVDEACLTVRLAGDGPPPPGSAPLLVELVRADDARYELRCRALGSDHADGQRRLFLAHDERPVRHQVREWVRVRVDLPVHCQTLHAESSAVPAPSPIRLEGRMVDLSAGGMALEARAPVAEGTLLECSFVLGNRAKFEALSAVVVGARATEQGATVRLAFTEVPERERDRLVAAVAWHEQNPTQGSTSGSARRA
jgi:c-di-GMP-binding flagellar brake protein YcgR